MDETTGIVPLDASCPAFIRQQLVAIAEQCSKGEYLTALMCAGRLVQMLTKAARDVGKGREPTPLEDPPRGIPWIE